ncbi:MAG: hypothetical protein WD059_08745 [Balneolaceae bacterium]
MCILNKLLLVTVVFTFIISGCKIGPKVIYSDVTLEYDREEGGELTRYKNGEPYTGTQTFRYRKTDKVYYTNTFEEGLLTQTKGFTEDNSIEWNIKFEYVDKKKARTMRFYPDGSIKEDRITASGTESGVGTTKMWHENGQLQFEMGTDENNQYHGLMTKWDEEGSVIEQENYEHGARVDI